NEAGSREGKTGRRVGLRRLVARFPGRRFTKQESLHLRGEEFARVRVARRQPVLVVQHGLVVKPLLPRFASDVFVDAVAELARPWRAIEAFGLALEFFAEDASGHRINTFLTGAGMPRSAISAREYQRVAGSSATAERARTPCHSIDEACNLKCVNTCRMTGKATAVSGSRAARREASSCAACSSAASGRLHNPGQTPCGGRRCNNTRSCSSRSTTKNVYFSGSARAGRAAGITAVIPARCAAQTCACGQASQRGFARVQTVAPRSMIACV